MALFLGRWREGVMVWMGAAYFDGSGGADTHTTGVAGGVSSVERWIEFEREWLGVLKDFSVTPPFHMKEFIRSRDGEFAVDKGWTNDRRIALMTALIDTILKNVDYTFSSVVPTADFARVDRDFCLHERFQPYSICAEQVLHQLVDWKNTNRKDEPSIAVVYENGDANQGQFMQILRDKGIDEHSITTAPKSKFVPFQFADILAWENGKLWRNAIEGLMTSPDDIRKSVERLENGPHDWGYHDGRTLRLFCAERGIAAR